MRRRAMYFAAAAIAAGIVSFTGVSSNQYKQPSLTVNTPAAGAGLSFEYNINGSVRQITWKENDTVLFVKTFAYANNTVTATEKMNNRIIKEETGVLTGGMLTGLKGRLFANDGTMAASYSLGYQYNDAGQTLRVMYGNGDRHDYVYDCRRNLIETNWYNRNGDITVSAKKQYFPKLPDAYTVYHRAADSLYARFIPVFCDKTSVYNKMSGKIKNRISFGGRYGYIMDSDGYVLNGF